MNLISFSFFLKFIFTILNGNYNSKISLFIYLKVFHRFVKKRKKGFSTQNLLIWLQSRRQVNNVGWKFKQKYRLDGRSSDGGQLALTFSFRSLAALLILAVTVTSTDHVLDFSLSGSLSLSNIFYFKNSYCFWLNAFYGDN